MRKTAAQNNGAVTSKPSKHGTKRFTTTTANDHLNDRSVSAMQRHKYHQYYNRECQICRQYVDDLYYKYCYYDHVNQSKKMSNRRRAHCGHCCLKYTILFYCFAFIVVSICVICYASKLFGLVSETLDNSHSSVVNKFQTTARIDVYAIIVSSVVMLIFFVGLMGTLVESLMCLRIFGAILAYLFLLTFGAFLYAIILLLLSNATVKVIAVWIGCAAVTIIVHASMAIAPFALSDLIQQEREDDNSETTYVKYPSVRYSVPQQYYPYPPYSYISEGPILVSHDASHDSRSPTAAKMSQSVRFEDDWL